MKCELCGKENTRFLRVNHPDYEILLICRECYRKEKNRLLPLPDERGSGCCSR